VYFRKSVKYKSNPRINYGGAGAALDEQHFKEKYHIVISMLAALKLWQGAFADDGALKRPASRAGIIVYTEFVWTSASKP
jgi:hypothetical protein